MRHAYILHLNVIQIEASHKKKMSIWKMFHSLHSFHDADFAYRLVMFIPISMHVKYKLSSASGEFFRSPAFNISDVDKTENTKATWNLKKRFNDAWNQLTMYRVWLKFVLNLSQVPRISNTCSPFFFRRPLLCACAASNSMKEKIVLSLHEFLLYVRNWCVFWVLMKLFPRSRSLLTHTLWQFQKAPRAR